MNKVKKIVKLEIHIGEKWAHKITLTPEQFWEFKCAMDAKGWFHIVEDCIDTYDGEWINTASITYINVETKYVEEMY